MSEAQTKCPRCDLIYPAAEPACPRCQRIRQTNILILTTVVLLAILAVVGWVGVIVFGLPFDV